MKHFICCRNVERSLSVQQLQSFYSLFSPFPLLLFCEFHKEKMLSHIWHMTIWHIATVRPYNLVSTEHEDDRWAIFKMKQYFSAGHRRVCSTQQSMSYVITILSLWSYPVMVEVCTALFIKHLQVLKYGRSFPSYK